MTWHLDVSKNPFPMDYDNWLTTEPDVEEDDDLSEDEPHDFDERRWRDDD